MSCKVSVLLSFEILSTCEDSSVAAEGTSTPLCAKPAHSGGPGGCAPYSLWLVAALPRCVLLPFNFGNSGNASARDPLLIAHAAHELVWISLKLFQAIE